MKGKEEPFGIPPVHTGYIESGTAKILTDEDINSNTADRISPVVFSMSAYTKHFIYYDIIDVQDQIGQYFSHEEIVADEQLVTIYNYLPNKFYTEGNYMIRIYYKIPGLDIITTYSGEYTMVYIIG